MQVVNLQTEDQQLQEPSGRTTDPPRSNQTSDRAATGECKQTPAGSSSAHNWLERMDIIAKLALSLVGLLLTAAIGFATIHDNRRAAHDNRLAAQRQIQNQIESQQLQRRATAAQILMSQLPIILRGKEQDRFWILKLLEPLDPDYVQKFGEILLVHANSPAAVEQAKQVIASSV